MRRPRRGVSRSRSIVQDEVATSRKEKTNSTTYEPMDFTNNLGALNLYFYIGDGYQLDGKEMGKDDAILQHVIQDDRELQNDLALREIGLGIGYERDFNWLGEFSSLLFYYDDELKDTSVSFLQNELTLRDNFGNPVAGYGNSNSNQSTRVGGTLQYHLEGYHLLDRWLDTSPGDGLYVTGQWIEAKDGDLNRDGWYVQGSYRFSFPKPLIAEKYIRYFEPVIRYGELNIRGRAIPALPLTWDRDQLAIGSVIGITSRIFVKGEYSIFEENTGNGEVTNDQLLVQLLIEF